MFKKKKNNLLSNCYKNKEDKTLVAMLWQEGLPFGLAESKEHPWPRSESFDFQPLLPSSLQHGWWLLPFFLPFFSLGPLALITNLDGFHWNFRREGIWNNQRLPRMLGNRSRKRGGRRDRLDLRMVIDAPKQPQSRVCRDSCSSQGFVPCRVAVITAYLRQLLG